MRSATIIAAVLLPCALLTASARAQMLSPAGDGCEDVIGRWQEFAAKESQGGHMDASVYEKIQAEIGQATGMCRSGQDAQAVRMIEASKHRHGY